MSCAPHVTKSHWQTVTKLPVNAAVSLLWCCSVNMPAELYAIFLVYYCTPNSPPPLKNPVFSWMSPLVSTGRTPTWHITVCCACNDNAWLTVRVESNSIRAHFDQRHSAVLNLLGKYWTMVVPLDQKPQCSTACYSRNKRKLLQKAHCSKSTHPCITNIRK